MKKVLFAAIAAFMLCGTAAHAQNPAPRFKFEGGAFRCHIATEVGVSGDPGGVDSAYASGIAKFDTTRAFSTANWVVPPVAGSLDSATIVRLFVYDAGLSTVTLGKTSATAESLYVKTQVSINGQVWWDCAVIPGQSPVLNAWTGNSTVNAGVIILPSVSQNTGSSDKLWTIRFVSAPMAAGRKDAIDVNRIHEFPLVRWIVSGTRATTNHSFRVAVSYLSQ